LASFCQNRESMLLVIAAKDSRNQIALFQRGCLPTEQALLTPKPLCRFYKDKDLVDDIYRI
jgi:hypothetical protein